MICEPYVEREGEIHSKKLLYLPSYFGQIIQTDLVKWNAIVTIVLRFRGKLQTCLGGIGEQLFGRRRCGDAGAKRRGKGCYVGKHQEPGYGHELERHHCSLFLSLCAYLSHTCLVVSEVSPTKVAPLSGR